MLSYEEALAKVLVRTSTLGTETVRLDAALFRVLAEDVATQTPLPQDDTSAMDGYAVRCSDFADSGPWQFPVVGESRAGVPSEVVTAGTTCRVFTGALLPPQADAVIIQENAQRIADEVRFERAPRPGDNVRRRGEDAERGRVVLNRGTRLSAFRASLLAALDRDDAVVVKTPRVGILCTGSELRLPGTDGVRGSIPESNSIAVTGLARAVGALTLPPLIVDDDLERTRDRVMTLLGDCDLLITVGGVSVGDHDVVKDALIEAGVQLDFWKVAIKPGKPLVFGARDKTLVLGLPGNPVSAQVTFCLFGIPLLKRLQGLSSVELLPRKLKLTRELKQKPGRRGFYRVTISGDRATPLDNQGSGSVVSLATADGLAIVPEGEVGRDAGDLVDVLCFADMWSQ